MKRIINIVFMIFCFTAMLNVSSKGENVMGSGRSFQLSPIHTVNGEVYIIKRVIDNPITSSTSVFNADVEDMSLVDLIKIRDDSSEVYIGDSYMLFCEPRSILSNFSYGPSKWYFCGYDSKTHMLGKKQLIVKNPSDDGKYRFFSIGNKIFSVFEPQDTGKDKLLYLYENNKLSDPLAASHDSIVNYDTMIWLSCSDNELTFYDVYSNTIRTVEFFGREHCDIIWTGDYLIYTTPDDVKIYEMEKNEIKKISDSEKFQYPHLYYDGSNYVYVFDSGHMKLFAYDINRNKFLNIRDIPKACTGMNFLVVGDSFLCYDEYSYQLFKCGLYNDNFHVIYL